MSSDKILRRVVKPVVFLLALVPAVYMSFAVLSAFFGINVPAPNLGPDPLKEITHETGDWTIRFICLTLAITPFRRFTGWNGVIKFRRMIGLYAFFYGCLHFSVYAIADRLASLVDFPQGVISLDTAHRWFLAVWEDIAKRPYITVGFTALVLMLPLAITSTTGWIRRLGGRNWNRLHRLIYGTAVLAVIHYWWLVKADITHPLIYAVIVGTLLMLRLIWTRSKKRPAVVVRQG